MQFQLIPLAAAMLAAFAHPAGASEADAGEITRILGTVTIAGLRPTSLPTQIPTTIEGITREQLQRTINATDAEDALKYLPSLLVRKRYVGDYNHAVLSTRASGTGNSARSAVYADGILLSNYLGNGAAFAPRWGMVAPEEIDRVDVLYGPFSAAYGGNSVGAVVDYVTRMPRQFEAHARFAYVHQPFDLYGTDAAFRARQGSFSLGDRVGSLSWFLSLNRTDSDGQPQTFANRLLSAGGEPATGAPVVTGAQPGKDRANRDWLILGSATQYATEQDQAKLKLAYDIRPGLRASYTLGWWRNDAQGRPDSYLRDASGNAVYSGPVSIGGKGYTLTPADFPASGEALQHVMHGLSLKSMSKGVFDWELAASRYEYQRDILRAPTTAQPAAAAGGAGRIVDQGGTGWHTLAVKGTWRPHGVRGAHIVDLGYQREAYQLSSLESASADWIAGPAGARSQAFAGRTAIDSLYAQDSWRFAAHWKSVLGARFERWKASGGASSNASHTVLHPQRTESFLSPKAALAFQPDEDWTLKASAGRAVRMPTVSELYQGGVNGQGTLVNGDPQLQPERSWTSELSAERLAGPAALRLTGFFERTTDALYSQTNVLVRPNVTNVQNVGRIRTRGLELAASRADAGLAGLDVNGSLTWTDSRVLRNDKFPASVGKRQPRIPEWRASAVASYRYSDRLSASAALRYSGRQYTTLDNSDPNGFTYQGSSRYLTSDLRLVYRLDRQWTLAGGVDNANNDKYWNFHPYPQRSWFAEVRFDL